MSPSQKIQYVYDLELNAVITWFFDAGFEVSIGDDVNGWIETADGFRTFDEAADWLYQRALEMFPES